MASWKLILQAWPLACLCAGVLSSYFLLVSSQLGSTVPKSVGKARRGYTAWRGGKGDFVQVGATAILVRSDNMRSRATVGL